MQRGSHLRKNRAEMDQDLSPGNNVEVEESSWINWQSISYLLVLGGICVLLAPATNLWWIVPVLGVAGPVVLFVLDKRAVRDRDPGRKKKRESELLEVLEEQGEVSSVTAATHTSLTANEASELLDELAGKGHLKIRTQDGVMVYSLPGSGSGPVNTSRETIGDRSGPTEAVVPPDNEQLDEPLSGRELEVLTLLAHGKTNSEISKDLFVALGTVKSHINNIYRKLGARNRAEAISQAQEWNLIR